MTSEATGAETGQTQAAPEGQAVPEAQATPSALAQTRPYDAEGVRKAVYDLLVAIGEDPERDGLRETPQRMARAYAELFAGLSEDPAHHLDKVFDVGHDEMVLVRDIPMYSVCEHHLLPFHGVAHVGYIPGRPQVQERLTAQVADAMVERLHCRGVLVVVEAEHLCMSMRGVRKPGSNTVTSAVRGIMRNPATRAEAMSLILGRRG